MADGDDLYFRVTEKFFLFFSLLLRLHFEVKIRNPTNKISVALSRILRHRSRIKHFTVLKTHQGGLYPINSLHALGKYRIQLLCPAALAQIYDVVT
jgi:hypothetical protein